MPLNVNIAQIVPATEAEGPGLRFAIWFQGCPLRCPGCCNPEMLKFEGGDKTTAEEICQQIKSTLRQHENLEGITLLGGEPFAHAGAAAHIADFAQSVGLTVMIFSGYLLEDLQAQSVVEIDRLIEHTDMLVDGPYDCDRPDTARRFIGSTNQRVHFLTDQYSASDRFWSESDTLEVRLENGELTVNGFPSQSAVGMWKKPRKPKRD